MKIYTDTGSIYEIDPEANTVTRMHVGDESNELRRDGEAVRIIEMPEPPTVGQSLTMVLDVRGDGILTIRKTSPVTKVSA